MSMAELSNSSNENMEVLNDFELKSIYQKISVPFGEEDFDYKEFESLVMINIKECFKRELDKYTGEMMQKDVEIVNHSFVQLMKHLQSVDLKKQTKYETNLGLLFVIFCDYFDMNYNISYENLHKNLKQKIEKSCKRLVGSKTFCFYQHKKDQSLFGNDDSDVKMTVKKIFDL